MMYQFRDVNESIQEYVIDPSSPDYLVDPNYSNHSTGTADEITKYWNEDYYTLQSEGTTTSHIANNYSGSQTSFPAFIERGKTYMAKVSTDDPKVKLQIVYWRADKTYIYKYIESDMAIVIDDDPSFVGLTLRLYVQVGFSGTAIIKASLYRSRLNIPYPAEAISVNGRYIEDEIEGYRTLSTTGRQLLLPDIQEYSSGQKIGKRHLLTAYPTRDIEVRYQLIANDSQDFREKYNKLSGILAQEEAQFIFNDELDKYFIGTVNDHDEVRAGSNAVTGTFTIHCSDPCKYSTTTKQFAAVSDGAGLMKTTIENEGNIECSIDYDIKNKSSNGYYGIVGADGIIELGSSLDYEETESLAKKSEMLLDYDKNDSADMNAFKTAVNASSSLGTGTTSQNASGKYVHESGKSFTLKTIGANRYITVPTLGSGSKFHGLKSRLTLKSSTDGDVASEYFKLSGKALFETNNVKSSGMMQVVCEDSSHARVCSMYFYKPYSTNNTCRVVCSVGGDQDTYGSANVDKYKYEYTGTNAKGFTGSNKAQDFAITKAGATFTFSFNGITKSYTVSTYASVGVKYITIFIGKYGTSPQMVNMGIGSFKFRKDNVVYTKKTKVKLPNRYGRGDEIYINGSKALPYLNGTPCIDDEVTGSSYFPAAPGDTDIVFQFDSDVGTDPEIVATIRERWI